MASIKWEFRVGEKSAEVTVSNDLTVEELEIVKEMLSRLIDARTKELKLIRNNKLPLSANIDSLYPELSVRARNVLKRSGCETIVDVLACSPSDLKRMRNMGKNTLAEIIERFGEYGSFAGSAEVETEE